MVIPSGCPIDSESGAAKVSPLLHAVRKLRKFRRSCSARIESNCYRPYNSRSRCIYLTWR